jgi:5-methyltetrahydropteroyltriglutamate--homocysteine methyltransferase
VAFTYRADHVGSLLRPQELLAVRKNPDTTIEELTALEDKYIQRGLDKQKELGFRIFTDGELRRGGFMSDFYDSVEGLDNRGEVARAWKAASPAPGAISGVGAIAGVVVEKIKQAKRLTSHETAFLNEHKPGDIKMTLPTPNQFPAIVYKKGMSEKAYPTRSEFLWDVVPIIKSEIQALLQEGVKYIQLDAPRARLREG